MRKDPKQPVSIVGSGLGIFSHPLRVEVEGKKEKTASRTGRVGTGKNLKPPDEEESMACCLCLREAVWQEASSAHRGCSGWLKQKTEVPGV